MLADMSKPRKPIRTAFTVLSALGGVAVLHEFAVKYAEQKGWYDNLPNRVEAAMTWLVSLSEPFWFKIGLAFVFGVTVGLWLDAFLRKREQRSEAILVAEIDKEALAREAEVLSAKVLALIAQHEGRLRAAFIAGARDPARDDARMVQAEGDLLERFAEKHWSDFQRIINLAMKVVSLNLDEYWWATNRIRGSDLESIAKYLAKLATNLRHPAPDIPMHSPLRDAARKQLGAQTNPSNPA